MTTRSKEHSVKINLLDRWNSNPDDTSDSSLAKYSAHNFMTQPLLHNLENVLQDKAEEQGTTIFLAWIKIQFTTLRLSETRPLHAHSSVIVFSAFLSLLTALRKLQVLGDLRE